MNVKVYKTLPGVRTPRYETEGAAGFDLAIANNEVVFPGETVMARTGLVIQAPADHMLFIVPRSSIRKRWGLSLGNTVGIVDEDFCGPEDELRLMLRRDGEWGSDYPLEGTDLVSALFDMGGVEKKLAEKYTIPCGTRLAQGIFVPVTRGEFVVTEEAIAASRGGWGSTGA